MEPALVVTHGDPVKLVKGEIMVVDVTDFNNIITRVLVKGDYAYDPPFIASDVEMVTNQYYKGSSCFIFK